jgi:hypothetical protein
MHQMLFLFEPGAILIALIAFSFLGIAIFRGRQIPQCFVCGAIKVRPSRPHGFLDHAARLFMIKAYRCAGCRARFHAMRVLVRSRHAS